MVKAGRDVEVQVRVETYQIGSEGAGNESVMNALKARISAVQSGQHVTWAFRVASGSRNWLVNKRFSELAAIHSFLVSRLQAVPELPPKSAVRQFSVEYLESRKDALNRYVVELCKRRDVLNCREVQEFFQLPQNMPEYERKRHESDIKQAAEVQESQFGLIDFAYKPFWGYLLLASSERSLLSRVDTKITNIKLPWESIAPKMPTSQLTLWRQRGSDMMFDVVWTARYNAQMTCCAMIPGTIDTDGWCYGGLSNGTVGYRSTNRSSSADHGLQGKTVPLLRHTAGIVALLALDEGQRIISASRDCALFVFDRRKQELLSQTRTSHTVSAMCVCETTKRLFCGMVNGIVIVWDISTMPLTKLCVVPDRPEDVTSTVKIESLDYNRSTSTLFTATTAGIRLWEMKSSASSCWGRNVGQFPGISGKPISMCWASSSRELIIGFDNGSIVIFDVDRPGPSYTLQAHQKEVSAMMWMDDARRLITCSSDKTLKFWNFPGQCEDLAAHLDGELVESPEFATSSMLPVGTRAERSDAQDAGTVDPLRNGSWAVPSANAEACSKSATRAAAVAAAVYSATGASGYPANSSSRPPPPPPRPPAPKPLGPALRGADDSDDDLTGWNR